MIKLFEEFTDVLKEIEYSKSMNSTYEELANKIVDKIENSGFETYGISKSMTPYGKSWYIRLDDNFNEPLQVRISDHDIGAKRFFNDRTITYFDINNLTDDIINNKIEYIIDFLKKEKIRKEKAIEKGKKEDEEYNIYFNEKTDMINYLKNKNLQVKSIGRTYKPIEYWDEKYPTNEDIYQLKVYNNGFNYKILMPIENNSIPEYDIDREYLKYLKIKFNL